MKRFYSYIDDVLNHNIKTGVYIYKAVLRCKKDLDRVNDPSYPYYFDERKAGSFIRFAEACKLYKDQFAGKPLKLEPWQVWIFANIYGWQKKETNTRRFKRCFVFVARKNGKSTMMSPVLLWDILTTKGGEAYCVATKRDQAKIVFESVSQMVKQNKALTERLKIFRSSNRIVNEHLASTISPLSADYNTLDGLNPSCIVADEVSAMKDYRLINVLTSGTYSRPEPLFFEITSGSDDLTSAGAGELEASKKLLDGVYQDDTFFTAPYTIDIELGDKWTDHTCYIKANPNLGVSLTLDALIKGRDEALMRPEMEGEFRVKNLCCFISPMTAFIKASTWDKCKQNYRDWGHSLPPIEECACIAGIDLSKRLDFTAYSVYMYHIPSKRFYTKHQFYIPAEQIDDKCKRESPLVRGWIEQGYITATTENGGKVCDYERLFEDLERDIEELRIKEVLFDPWNAGELIHRMQDKCDLVECRQSLKNMSPYAKDWEASVINGEISDNNPVMAWMVSNCDVERDRNGNIGLIKHGGKDSHCKIDGCITSVMACGRIKQLLSSGEIDIRTAEELERDLEQALQAFAY